MDKPTTYIAITTVTVCALPEDFQDREFWEIHIERTATNPDRWAVRRRRQCLSIDGQWDFEPIPSGRDTEWLEAHRFDWYTAHLLAARAAPDITVNGRRAADLAVKWEADRG